MAKVELKKPIVDQISEELNGAKAAVLVDYRGITVEQDTALRNELRKAGVDYHVYKNTMTARACEAAGYGDMKQYLEGMTALAISANDPIAPAKILKEYADKVESFEIKAGFIDGGVIDAATVNDLANIPGREVLIGRLLGSIQSPLYGLAFGIQAIIDKEGGVAEDEAPAAEAAEA